MIVDSHISLFSILTFLLYVSEALALDSQKVPMLPQLAFPHCKMYLPDNTVFKRILINVNVVN